MTPASVFQWASARLENSHESKDHRGRGQLASLDGFRSVPQKDFIYAKAWVDYIASNAAFQDIASVKSWRRTRQSFPPYGPSWGYSSRLASSVKPKKVNCTASREEILLLTLCSLLGYRHPCRQRGYRILCFQPNYRYQSFCKTFRTRQEEEKRY